MQVFFVLRKFGEVIGTATGRHLPPRWVILRSSVLHLLSMPYSKPYPLEWVQRLYTPIRKQIHDAQGRWGLLGSLWVRLPIRTVQPLGVRRCEWGRVGKAAVCLSVPCGVCRVTNCRRSVPLSALPVADKGKGVCDRRSRAGSLAVGGVLMPSAFCRFGGCFGVMLLSAYLYYSLSAYIDI